MLHVALLGDEIEGVHVSTSGSIPFYGEISSASPNVYINGHNAVRVDDITTELCPVDGVEMHSIVNAGSLKVFINGRSAAYGCIQPLTPHDGALYANITGGGSTNVFIE